MVFIVCGRHLEKEIMVADIEELEYLDASEIHARRLNAKDVLDQLHAAHHIEWKTSRRIHVVWEAADKNSSDIKARLFWARNMVRNVEISST